MKSTAYEIALLLEANGIGDFGSSAKWSINVSQEPTEPPDCITLYDTGGFEYSPEPKIFVPTILVRVRSIDHQEGYGKQDQIRNLLVDFVNQNFGQSYYIGIWNQGDILSLGTDENDRYLSVSNYRVERQSLGV